jgi:hypothetical protein
MRAEVDLDHVPTRLLRVGEHARPPVTRRDAGLLCVPAGDVVVKGTLVARLHFHGLREGHGPCLSS